MFIHYVPSVSLVPHTFLQASYPLFFYSLFSMNNLLNPISAINIHKDFFISWSVSNLPVTISSKTESSSLSRHHLQKAHPTELEFLGNLHYQC